jgi:hypothetical protein
MPLVFPSTCPSIAYPLECVPVAAPYAMFMENGVKQIALLFGSFGHLIG